MESTTMTSATQISGVGHACPQAKTRLAVTRGRAQGTTVPTLALEAAFVPAFRDVFGTPIAPKSIDVVHLRTGEPPV